MVCKSVLFDTQLLEMLSSYTEFEIDDITGEALTLHNRIDIHYDRVLKLQVQNSNKHFNDVMHI